MKKSLVYLACPYSHPDPEVRGARFRAVNQAAAVLVGAGVHVFSPITHTHPLLLTGGLPHGWSYWEEYDRAVLSTCLALVVLQLEGWDQSEGVRGEVSIAGQLGMACYFASPERLTELAPNLKKSLDSQPESPKETPSHLRFAAKIARMLEEDGMSNAAQWVLDRAAEPQP